MSAPRVPSAADGFLGRWRARAARTSRLGVGLGPSPERLAWWGLPDTLAAARTHSFTVVDAVADRVSLVKIQTPFFERFGGPGLELLRAVVDRARAGGALVVLDAKRCDAPDVARVLPELYLGEDSVLGGDAVTLVPWMGLDSLEPTLVEAGRRGCGVLLMARTSNHAAGTVQHAVGGTGDTVSRTIAEQVAGWNRAHGTDHLGAVVGAPGPEARELVARTETGLVSLPGLGRQGRSVASVVAAAGDQLDRAVLPVTSGLLRGAPERLSASLDGWLAEVDDACERARRAAVAA
ncbi:orotidine-5'-phosphate decarboxylase [Streptomyces triticirhizae]|uniref:Orotidine-5'-phosphate decarboxylase n=1 Tax=Streptomyces triticirhizae TaxID=2483353 RepID=A0A3M2LHI0_9ACTN|nr:orotidine-5'-phosphate decarboxylase [Streptomyces triticirhizae]RMI36240.1 orotidine-5'-phosphate decarboxylase [Streptomyces triticirhizae]